MKIPRFGLTVFLLAPVLCGPLDSASAQSNDVSVFSPLPPSKPSDTTGSGPKFQAAPLPKIESEEAEAKPPEPRSLQTEVPSEPVVTSRIEVAPLDQLEPVAPEDGATTAQPGQLPEGGVADDDIATAPTNEGAGIAPTDRFQKAPFSTTDPMTIERPIAALPTAPSDGAVLRELDKFSGITTDVEIASGSEAIVDRLRIKVEGCRAPVGNSSQGTMAYLRIWDTKDPDSAEVFHGWMFAESPALSAMDHPRYDVWLIKCSAREGEASTASE